MSTALSFSLQIFPDAQHIDPESTVVYNASFLDDADGIVAIDVVHKMDLQRGCGQADSLKLLVYAGLEVAEAVDQLFEPIGIGRNGGFITLRCPVGILGVAIEPETVDEAPVLADFEGDVHAFFRSSLDPLICRGDKGLQRV